MMNFENPLVFAVKHKDFSTRMESRSGGVFTALSDSILDNDGVVYGCVLTKNFEAIHIRTKDKKERNCMRGSKYIESKLGNVFNAVKEDVQEGTQVLFSGTSCQIAGLKKFLEQEYKNLVCVDILCHGVPSPAVWRKYLEWQKSKYGECISVDFRNKKDFGWADHVETLLLKNRHNAKVKQVNSRVFTSIFYSHLALRPSCHFCPYKNIIHPGDITIADYWEIEKAAPKFNDNKGVSLVFINNDLGEKVFENIKSEIEWKSTKIENSIRPSMLKSCEIPRERNKFWRDFFSLPFEKVAKRYGNYGWLNIIKSMLRKYKKKILNNYVK